MFEDGVLIAIGGITQDQYLHDPQIGRLRRIYVRARWRGRGAGTRMVEYLLAVAEKSFRGVRLRAQNERAGRLYERLGFRPLVDPEATHILWF